MSFYSAYSSFCASTAKYPLEVENPYLALGLCSEAAELQGALVALYGGLGYNEFFKELGDCQWYLCRMANAYGFEYGQLVSDAKMDYGRVMHEPFPKAIEELTRQSGLIAGRIKKQLRDGHLWNGEQREEFRYLLRGHMLQVLVQTFVTLDRLWRVSGGKSGNFDALLQANIDKLRGREERGTLQGDGDSR